MPGNAYLREPGGVLLGNWYEERLSAQPEVQAAPQQTAVRGPRRARAPPPPPQPEPRRAAPRALRLDPITAGSPAEPQACYWSTLNSLAFSGEGPGCRFDHSAYWGMPRVQDALWTGRNNADANVPIAAPPCAASAAGGLLTAQKRAAWAEAAAADPWSTASKAAAQSAALAAAAEPPPPPPRGPPQAAAGVVASGLPCRGAP
ncbi:hypothetical protein Rsub_07601 [Raphidocelis subcapitata]|uniref:Uncharacterized protein n=1 Tax=Raphidocelis subcapitata TaxID=307507 RepID=A0A2V0P4D0_9CHLO|nr:hypothetical protein Rsub_07601 [Raphidocelis subcapitata]|eukprot:GBF94718.1 hypothetical protein Rsub_07601 [Raphidocelis subcapitata]